MFIKRFTCLSLCFCVFYFCVCQGAYAEDRNQSGTDNIGQLEQGSDEDEGPVVTSKSAVVIDGVTHSVLFEKAANTKYEISHLVKLMTLLLVAENIDNGKLSLDTVLTTSQSANATVDPQIWLNVGEKITIDELIKSITVGNANDAAVVLAEGVAQTESRFVEFMNERAASLGMNDTMFTDCTGKDKNGNYSTAYDVALLCSEVLKHEYLSQYMTTWMCDVRGGETNLANTNKLVNTYSGITGVKAASSAEAGNCLALSATRRQLPLICVVLGAKSNDKRFDEAKVLMDHCYSLYEYYVPRLGPDVLLPVCVKGGQQITVPVKCENDIGLVISKGTSANISTQIMMEDKINAPVTANQVLGYVEFKSGDKVIFKTNILACNNVDKTDIPYCFKKLINKLMQF